MAYSSIVKSSDYFNTKLYTGGATDVSSLSFQPDFVWAKKRSGSENHGLFDAVRGATKTLSSNDTAAESTRGGSLTSFDSDGWSMGGSDGIISASGSTYVGWAWKAGGGQGSSNTDGSVNTTYTSVNTTAGFSISTVSKPNTNVATIGHGLGATPKFIIGKDLDTADNFTCYHESLGNGKGIYLNSTNGETTASSFWNSTSPTNSVFTLGSDNTWNSPSILFYCFAEKAGFSKFGSYVGNNNANGPFIYTGFKPAWVMVKNSSSSGFSWEIFDNKRNATDGVTNVIEKRLFPDSNAAEGSNSDGYLDFVSNGFKIRKTGDSNAGNETYIYVAFAEEPLVANSGASGVPATAR